MSKKVYIIIGCVVAAILIGMLVYLLATVKDLQKAVSESNKEDAKLTTEEYVKNLQEAVAEFNSEGALSLPTGCYEYKTVYDPNNNVVSVEYFFTHNRFENEGFGVMDEHPYVKDEWEGIIEENVIKNSLFSKILKLMVTADASLRVRFVDRGNENALVFKWNPNEIRKIGEQGN